MLEIYVSPVGSENHSSPYYGPSVRKMGLWGWCFLREPFLASLECSEDCDSCGPGDKTLEPRT